MTHAMTEKQTKAWLDNYFFGNGNVDFTEIYKSSYTRIYEWNLDKDVEVVRTLCDADTDEESYVYTVNCYENRFSYTPYRTGTVRIDGI